MLTRRELLLTPLLVSRARAGLQPLIAKIESTPREKCASMAAEALRSGISYREFMAALFLAGIRNVNPRPPGFALHCVFVIHAAHTLTLEAPADVRRLPLFYALDSFKTAQERDRKAAVGDYQMGGIAAGSSGDLEAAMEAWDMDRAERAAAAVARYRSPGEAFELLWQYGARDYRNIGHKAIFAANAHRTLQTIGWEHAEPVLRSLVLGMLDFGTKSTMNGFALEDQCYFANRRRVAETFAKLPDTWADREGDDSAARSILEVLRDAPHADACADLATRLVKGQATAGSVWDAIHLSAAELRMRAGRSTVIGGIHAVSAINALHHAWFASMSARTRYLLLLQAAGWIAQFREWMAAGKDGLRNRAITALSPIEGKMPDTAQTLAGVPGDLDQAASCAMRMAQDGDARTAFLNAAMRQSIAKVDEVHYYKYLAALIEDIRLVSPRWQPHLTAACVYYLKGPQDPVPAPMELARQALA
ncbi:MAG: hypothetical protein FJW39_03280 [Acidobacteria bacterium]|nr:hypothetical protein [Acidobacteriota bacterium]